MAAASGVPFQIGNEPIARDHRFRLRSRLPEDLPEVAKRAGKCALLQRSRRSDRVLASVPSPQRQQNAPIPAWPRSSTLPERRTEISGVIR
jgi:hypothetical protein